MFPAEFMKIYDIFDIKNLVDRGESFYQPLMADVVSELEEMKMVELDEVWSHTNPLIWTVAVYFC